MTASPPRMITIPGKLVVEMTTEERYGDLLIPARVQRPTQYAVVRSEPFTTRVKGVDVVSPPCGARVLVHKDDGMWVEDKDLCPGQIRVYGHFAQSRGEAVECAWWHSVLIDMDNVQAFGDKVWIKHQDEHRTDGGIWLPDAVAKKGAYGTVQAAGPLAFDLEAGQTVCYDPRATIAEFEDSVVVPFVAINYVKA